MYLYYIQSIMQKTKTKLKVNAKMEKIIEVTLLMEEVTPSPIVYTK